MSEWPHLNRSGRRTLVWLSFRRLFAAPARDEVRCFMGAPVGERVHCDAVARPGRLWCRWHDPELSWWQHPRTEAS